MLHLSAVRHAQHPRLKSVFVKGSSDMSDDLFSSFRTVVFKRERILQDFITRDLNFSHEALVERNVMNTARYILDFYVLCRYVQELSYSCFIQHWHD